ncbi:hypothetical protein ANAPRD1_00242 [Anaplasma phagocytophilum]|nr:hypothetical protein ANAPRD1_00242 [Anaplasma phagocytophilum]
MQDKLSRISFHMLWEFTLRYGNQGAFFCPSLEPETSSISSYMVHFGAVYCEGTINTRRKLVV